MTASRPGPLDYSLPAMARRKTQRLGRPPASSAADTRDRIISVACGLFSTMGYGVTTNRNVADQAGVTTSALYYYFDSKLAMYMAVYEELQKKVNERFAQATAGIDTFDASIRAVLQASAAMNEEDPSIAAFQGAARTDRLRHPELMAAIPNPPGEGASLVPGLVALGIETGEIDPARTEQLTAVLRTLFVGLVDGVSNNLEDQRNAIDGIMALLDGDLIRRPVRRKNKAG